MKQGSLFDLPANNEANRLGLAGLMANIRARMNAVAAEYAPGRKQLVEDISAIAQKEAIALTSGGAKSIDLEQLNKWLQPKADAHAPTLQAIICFCKATSSYEPLKPLFDALGLAVITASDLHYLEYGKLQMRIKEDRARAKALEGKL